MLSKEIILLKLEENAKVIRGYGVKKLELFGSYANGTATGNSDIDFLVEFEQGQKTFDNYIDLLHLLEEIFHKDIDLGEEQLLHPAIRNSVNEGNKYAARIQSVS